MRFDVWFAIIALCLGGAVGCDDDGGGGGDDPPDMRAEGEGEGEGEGGDDDDDGVLDEVDNCPFAANPDQEDADGDDTGDACDLDIDGDGVENDFDNCPNVENADQANTFGDARGDACEGRDSDRDGVADDEDNCPQDANPDQEDADEDGVGDACDDDTDTDNDGVADEDDNCPNDENPDQEDNDNDGEGDACDADLDGDGVGNLGDNCRDAANPGQDAADMDGFTVLAMVAELAGDAPSLDNQTVGIGLDSNSGAAALISSVRALYDTTLKVQTSRTQLLGGKHDLDEGVDPIDWLALRFGHNQFTSWAGEGAAPAHLNETDYRACSGWSATPTKTDGLHNCKTGRWRIFAAADGAAATFAPAISRLSFYEVAG